MVTTGALASLGDVMQLAFVPADFDAAVKHWTEVIGAGPFFLLPNMSLPGGRYRGAASDPIFTMALGYWGDMQIELIRPENDAASIYRGEYAVGEGLHHVCILVDSIAEARARCEAVGAEIIFEAPVGDTGGVIYADPGTGPGNLIELLEPQPGTRELFAMMRDASRRWDGSEPLRSLG
ncbi:MULTISPECIES: VOC family protein [unclassified Sphingopyxis]|uniref:VOC family protein n=1 Tax=unclassified Sphingopyxis TaxID=2614943 RepID=UPI00286286B7|nr:MULTISPECIES: VOC family protein [unclassified Sphingopyxis]MDR6833427.1 catechol 2,3-dioxygenase-like lactoylglutathione lyase family enzyme [Sphingopyxis sp. BE122]MDR7225696.1 catechol 2,3-dioxygenase-like lactoylglutathione lyase family enzyme [Sphingopyxis sp. BE259]